MKIGNPAVMRSQGISDGIGIGNLDKVTPKGYNPERPQHAYEKEKI